MDAREVIATQIPFPLDDEIYSEKIIKALTAAGYQIIHNSENHGPTLERAAESVERRNYPSVGDARRIASAIRAMGEKK